MNIGRLAVARSSLRPMAGMTDTAFRRLVKRHGGCGLVVTEMVSSEGLVRGIDRTLEYAEYTEEERPVSIQIFGGDPEKMAAAAQIVEGMGADIVDVNMGCPVPKIAKHNAGCSLMREPAHAATRHQRDDEGREDSGDREDARRLERRDAQCAGARATWWRTPARRRSRFTAARRSSPTAGSADWELVARVADDLSIPVFGSGDCVEPEQIVERMSHGVQRRARRSRRAAQSLDPRAGGRHRGGPPAASGHAPASAGSSCSTTSRCCSTSASTKRRLPPRRAGRPLPTTAPARGRERWVINKLRALCCVVFEGTRRRFAPARRVSTPQQASPSCATSSTTFFERSPHPSDASHALQLMP